MPLRDGFFSTATQTSCCNRIQRSNRVRLLVVSTHDFPDKVEHMMFLESNRGCLPEVQKYKAVSAAQQERRSQCLQDVQSAQEAVAGETVGIEIQKSW